MREQAANCNCAALQQTNPAQHEQLFTNCTPSSGGNYNCSYSNNNNNNTNNVGASAQNAKTTQHMKKRRRRGAPASRPSAKSHCSYCNLNGINKLLIITLPLLLITMTTTICQVGAASLLSGAALKAAAAPSSFIAVLSPTQQQQLQQQQQQRQLQQQQLFALLTRNRQAALTTSTTTSGMLLPHDEHHRFDEEDSNDNASAAVATSLETTGFVADDGQQYEKAEQALAAAAAANNNNNNNNNNSNQNDNANNCPKECKCLNDYFDCGKKHLDRVPELPNYVKIIDLVGNKLNDTTALEITNLSELQKLSLKRNQLENIPKFVGLSALKQLNLANNQIQRISSEALAVLPKLKTLDLSKNYLHTLEISYFPPANHIAHLILHANEIANVDENAFERMGELLDLDLNNNRLTTLPGSVFQHLHKLRKLSLNYNHLEINWSTFRGLLSLQKLFLKSNNIRALQDGVFHVMRSIETIELDHNHITSLSRQGLFNLTKLHHLSLSNNSISRIEPDTWEFTQSLIVLDLSHNNISEFKPQHLDCLQRLRHLNLGHNKIDYLSENTFECVKNLEELVLRRNRLAWIIEDTGIVPVFKGLRKLKKLDLYGNNLKQIHSKSLSGLGSLETLNLGGNSLASIQSDAFEYMKNLQKLTFKSMNFICDCELLWFRRWLQRSPQVAQLKANAVCGYPEHLLDRELLSLTPAELICADTPKPYIAEEPVDQLTVKGANITMKCIANSPAAASLAAADELKIKWRHDNKNIRDHEHAGGHNAHAGAHHKSTASGYGYSSTETQIHHDQATNQTTIIGYLHLYNVSYEQGGKYQCVVSNAFGTTYSQKFKISIGIHPTFLQIPSNLTIDSGDTARLVCSATGDPMPEIALQKFSASDFPAATERRLQVIRAENAFVITNAKPIDTGIYTCTAESAAGEIKINASLIVNDKPQPEIPITRKEITVGDSSVLECLTDLAADLNQPHREWFKDNKPFHPSSLIDAERYYFTPERKLLVILNTTSIDAGHYRCEITDTSKTFTLQMELVVVKEDLALTWIIVIVLVACITFGTLIVCCMQCYRRRKRRNGLSGGGSAIGARVAASQLNCSRGSALDQTQLTNLNRTFLQKPTTQQRPRSLADLESHLNGSVASITNTQQQRNRMLDATIPTLNYQHLLQSDAHALAEGFTLEYLQHNGGHEGSGENNQDQLSSKDSGTGSDAAVKRSIEDFTLSMLPPAGASPPMDSAAAQLGAATPLISSTPSKRLGYGRAALAKADTYEDDDEEEDDDDTDAELQYAATHALGVSLYDVEMAELNRGAEADEHARFLRNNNQALATRLQQYGDNNFDGGGGGGGALSEPSTAYEARQQQIPTTKLKSTNFNTNAVATTQQAVDI